MRQNALLFSVLLLLAALAGCTGQVEDESIESTDSTGSKDALDPSQNTTTSNQETGGGGPSSTLSCAVSGASTPAADVIFHVEWQESSTKRLAILEIDLCDLEAPVHSNNFREHVKQGNYDDSIFHRVIDDFMIQGGDFETGSGYGGYAATWQGYCKGELKSQSECGDIKDYTLPDEVNNGLKHSPGVLSMAHAGSNTGGSQFFFVDKSSSTSHLDGVHTVFGSATAGSIDGTDATGIDVIDAISQVAVGQGNKPVNDVTITKTELVTSTSSSGSETEIGNNTPDLTNTTQTNPTENETKPPSTVPDTWTVMVYISDSDLEYFAIEDIVEMETVGSTDAVNIVVQFDRYDGYDAPNQDDSSNGDWLTAKRFHIQKDAHGSLGDHQIFSQEVEDIGEINSGDPDELVKFVQWAQTTYPAGHYMLDIWDHGSGASGVAYEQSDSSDYYDLLELPEIKSALSQITDSGQNKLDIVGFDACLMSTIEVVNVVYPYADIMLGSEIVEPGTGWDYTFLQSLVDDPTIDAQELGTKIVDTFVAQSAQNPDQSFTLSMLDMNKAEAALSAWNALPSLKSSTSLIADLEAVRDMAIPVEKGGSSSAVDMIDLLEKLASHTADSTLKSAVSSAASAASDLVIYDTYANVPSDVDMTGMKGISVLFPQFEDEWRVRSKGVSSSLDESGWDDVWEEYYDSVDDDFVLYFSEGSLIYDTADLDGDGMNDSMSLALDIESYQDLAVANLTLDVYNNRGYWIEGVEYEVMVNTTEIVRLDIGDVPYIHFEENGPGDQLKNEAVLSWIDGSGDQVKQD